LQAQYQDSPKADLLQQMPRRSPRETQFADHANCGTLPQSTEPDAAENVVARHGQSCEWQRKLARMANGDVLTFAQK